MTKSDEDKKITLVIMYQGNILSTKLTEILKEYEDQLELTDYADVEEREIFKLKKKPETKFYPPCIKKILNTENHQSEQPG